MGSREHDEFLSVTLPMLDHLYNLARRLVPTGQVEDIVQETYVRAFEAWMKGRKPRAIKPWIVTICLNTGRSLWRQASIRREIPTEDFFQADSSDVEAEAIAAVDREAVHEALWSLPEEQRIAIALMDLDGFTASEVARLTGAPRGTVLARVHRGRKKLARRLSKKVIAIDP
ncbi:MAG: RNA polymerase sigma factor [Actinomycetota bacterium]